MCVCMKICIKAYSQKPDARDFATLLNMLISCFLTDRIHSSDWCFPRLWNTKLLCGKIN